MNKQVNDTIYKNDFYIIILAVEMNLSKRITKVDINSTNDKVTISNNEEQIDEAETVIVTVPVPQVLSQLKGSIAQLIGNYKILLKIILYMFFSEENNQNIKDKLGQVKYSSRFAVGLFYSTSIINLNIPWRIYYVDKKDNDCLRFLAVDNAKRNKS